MEGRAAARPDSPQSARIPDDTFDLQWRAGQLPGLTVLLALGVRKALSLQWRAGQLPGLT